MKILQAAGYHTTHAAGSLGMFDVIAINAQGIRLVQVKSNRDASPQEREAIQLFDGLRRMRRRKSGSSGTMRGRRSSRLLSEDGAVFFAESLNNV
jgi:hypothetical protein